MGTMGAERQHLYKVRVASFPCAWSAAGADSMARVRSWVCSGFGLPARAREGVPLAEEGSARGCEVRGATVRNEGRIQWEGWEHPVSASLAGLASDIRLRAS